MSSRRSTARPSATPARSRRRAREIEDDEESTHSIGEHERSPDTSQASSLRPLPAYIPPAAPLNVTAVHALQTLDSRSETLRHLRQAHDSALASLQDAAATVYERHCSYQGFYERTQAQLAEMERIHESQQGRSQVKTQPGEDANEEQEDFQKPDPEEVARQQERIHAHRIKVKQRRDDTTNMKRKADEVHAEVEEKVRQIIDGKARLEDYSAVLGEVSGNVQRGDGRVAPTQSTLGASQFRSNRPQATMDTEGDEEEGENGTARPLVSAHESIQTKLQDRKAAYEGLSMGARYAQNNDYIGFRRMVHDAQHPEDGVSLPHPDTWFAAVDGEGDGAESGHQAQEGSDFASNIPGAFPADSHQTTNQEDSDSDIEIARERISTRCPLTLQELRDPVTAKACGHTFEASAVAEMIHLSQMIIGGVQEQRGRRIVNVGGEKGIRCPVGSCTEKFGLSGLHRDPAMTRKIKRQQERQREMEENGEYEGGGGGEQDGDGGRRERAISIETIDSDDGSLPGGSRPVPSASMKTEDAVRVKMEGRSSVAPPASTYQARADTSVPREISVLEDDEMDEDYEDLE